MAETMVAAKYQAQTRLVKTSGLTSASHAGTEQKEQSGPGRTPLQRYTRIRDNKFMKVVCQIKSAWLAQWRSLWVSVGCGGSHESKVADWSRAHCGDARSWGGLGLLLVDSFHDIVTRSYTLRPLRCERRVRQVPRRCCWQASCTQGAFGMWGGQGWPQKGS